MLRLSLGPAPGTLRVEGLAGQRGATPLQPGATLTLRPEQAADGRLIAPLGRLSLPLPKGLGATAGTPLQVRVTGTPERPLLEIVTPQAGSRAGPEQAAQRRYLPRQAPLAQAVTTLTAGSPTATAHPDPTSARPQASEPALPPAVSRLLGQLLRLIPTPERLASPEGLRTALRDSGVFFEPSLALAPKLAPEIAGRDLKAALARLATQVRQSATGASARATTSTQPATRLADIGQAAEGALARLALLQLSNSNAPDTRVDLAFELPVAHGGGVDELALRIREEDEGGGDPAGTSDDERWELALRFRFTDIGRLDARVRLNGDRIGVVWWSENGTLARRVEAALPELEQRLEAVGLTVGEIRARRGAPPDDPISEPSGGGLLDERA